MFLQRNSQSKGDRDDRRSQRPIRSQESIYRVEDRRFPLAVRSDLQFRPWDHRQHTLSHGPHAEANATSDFQSLPIDAVHH